MGDEGESRHRKAAAVLEDWQLQMPRRGQRPFKNLRRHPRYKKRRETVIANWTTKAVLAIHSLFDEGGVVDMDAWWLWSGGVDDALAQRTQWTGDTG